MLVSLEQLTASVTCQVVYFTVTWYTFLIRVKCAPMSVSTNERTTVMNLRGIVVRVDGGSNVATNEQNSVDWFGAGTAVQDKMTL